jgi:serine/threonine protein phosphatase 1
MFGWLKPKPAPALARRAAVPAGVRVYAIGDIHGRLDCLNELLARIEADSANYAGTKHLIPLGDYIDRGPDSRGVIDRFIQGVPGFDVTALMGNHEQQLISLFETPEAGILWLTYGGLETLMSYDITLSSSRPTPEAVYELQGQLRELFPSSHLDWLRGLQTHTVIGDYFFAHAGVDPHTPLHKQKEGDLLWIRDPFLHYRGTLDKVVVHGHTISDEAEILAHRIGIDTGAYASGRLTALVLEGEERRLLQTGLPQ